METAEENCKNVLKRRKPNIFQRLSQRISKYFHRPKALKPSKDDRGSKASLTELPVTSKSHDDLSSRNKSRKKQKKVTNTLNCIHCGGFKRLFQSRKGIPKTNSRCLSEGDLTRQNEQFYSQDNSPEVCTPQTYESRTNDPSKNDSNVERAFSHKERNVFKNELALKLRAKNQVKDNESEHSKTPDSPTRYDTTASPSRQCDAELRTPRSMSSLSHSSNSLLSGTPATNYGLSDVESMSRSMIDSSDDIGIVVDLATPICKTTTASLLDSTAARQKIAASKARRARPKAMGTITGDTTSVTDGAQFSPIREKRDILEEIREEECIQSPHTPEIPEDDTMSPVKTPCSYLSKDHSSEETSLTAKRLSSKSQSSTEDLPCLNETGDSTKQKIPTKSEDIFISKVVSSSLRSEDSSLSKEKVFDSNLRYNSSLMTKSNVKSVAELGDSKERHLVKSSSESEGTSFKEKVDPKSLSDTGDSSSLKEQASTKSSFESESHSEEEVALNTFSKAAMILPSSDKPPALTTSETDEVRLRFSQNMYKFQADKDKPGVTPRFNVKLKPVGNSLLENISEKSKEHKEDNNIASHHREGLTICQDKDISSDHLKNKDATNFTRYVPLRRSKVTAIDSASITSAKDSLVTPDLTIGDKRASKVLDMVKNLEGVS